MTVRPAWDREVGRNASTCSLRPRVQRGRGSWLVHVQDKSTFQLQAAANEAVTINLAQNISSRHWGTLLLLTRIFGVSSPSTTAAVGISVLNAMVGADDPATHFPSLAGRTAIVAQSSSFTASGSQTFLDVAASANVMGPQVQVVLQYTQGASIGAMTITLGVLLLARRR